MEGKIRLKLVAEDLDSGTCTELDKIIQLYPDLGWECGFIGEFSSILNQFIKLLGYSSYDKDYVFLESVTLEEYDELYSYLQDLRENK